MYAKEIKITCYFVHHASNLQRYLIFKNEYCNIFLHSACLKRIRNYLSIPPPPALFYVGRMASQPNLKFIYNNNYTNTLQKQTNKTDCEKSDSAIPFLSYFALILQVFSFLL